MIDLPNLPPLLAKVELLLQRQQQLVQINEQLRRDLAQEKAQNKRLSAKLQHAAGKVNQILAQLPEQETLFSQEDLND